MTTQILCLDRDMCAVIEKAENGRWRDGREEEEQDVHQALSEGPGLTQSPDGLA